ncbi:MAG: P1 family peptidase [Oscillospiraceae bacterium]|nr:P1 family peptidase [Oscillospiraceae bacterium]
MEGKIGRMPQGPRNNIADVAGVTVGHCTVDNDHHKTGVTVVMPCENDIFRSKMVAACHVLNGFGKTAGLMQIQELGTLETPIALTNTLNVGLVHDAMVEYMCRQAETGGYSIRSVNPVVAECNDASLNDIRHRAVGQTEVFAAIEAACSDFEQGDVGAGKGMTCHDLKGGIGSSSRLIDIGEETFTLGILALTNHGSLSDLTIHGKNVGMDIEQQIREDTPDEGSCILILATDLPVTSRQLGRIIRRCSVGLARLGSFIGHGSGEVFIGFSTANRIPEDTACFDLRCIHEAHINKAFRAAAEATEEAVLQSLLHAKTVTGYSGKVRRSLTEFYQP